jgi:hypothetical protein
MMFLLLELVEAAALIGIALAIIQLSKSHADSAKSDGEQKNY